MSIKKEKANSPKKVVLIGIIFSAIITSVLLVSIAFIMTVFDVPKVLASPLSSTALGAGSFFGSLATAKRIGKNGYLYGILNALCLIFCVTLAGMIAFGAMFTAQTPIRLAIVTLCGILGGIVGVNGKQKKKL